eukprot:767280-Hanusia_phi.AAC.4
MSERTLSLACCLQEAASVSYARLLSAAACRALPACVGASVPVRRLTYTTGRFGFGHGPSTAVPSYLDDMDALYQSNLPPGAPRHLPRQSRTVT